MDYALVVNNVSSGSGFQVGKENNNLLIEIFMSWSASGKCMLICQCLFMDY